MMLRTLLLASSLVTTVTSAKEFTGPGTVQCPDAGGETQCEFSFTTPGAAAIANCVLDCPEAANFLLGSLWTNTDKANEFNLPCDCTQATNCPDSCTFTPGASGGGDNTDANTGTGTSINTTSTSTSTSTTTNTPGPVATVPGDYVGPGFLTCDSLQDFLSCNISIVEDCIEDATTCGIPDFSSILDYLSMGDLSIPLLCDCVQATDCPCTFAVAEIDDSNTTSFTGVGTVICPVADFALEPCFPINITNTDDPQCANCKGFDFAPFLLRNEFSEIQIPLPCECLSVAGCAASCTFLDSVVVTKTTFEGPGRLTCDIDDYFGSPCIPVGDCDGEGFACVTDALSTLNITNTTFSIDVSCACVSLPDCSSECKFDASMPVPPIGSPTNTSSTMAPAPAPSVAANPPPTTTANPAVVMQPSPAPVASSPVTAVAPPPTPKNNSTLVTPTSPAASPAVAPSTPTIPQSTSGSTLLIGGAFWTTLTAFLFTAAW